MHCINTHLSPCNNSWRFLPSNDTQDVFRLSGEMEIFNSTPAGTTIGRKLNECGQMGVTIIAGTDGWIIEAPAATAYAVLPVGVETIRPSSDKSIRILIHIKIPLDYLPSPCTEVMCLPSKNKSILLRYGDGPRSITTSFNTKIFGEGNWPDADEPAIVWSW